MSFKLSRVIKAPRWTIIGVIGVIMMYVGTSGIVSTVAPWSLPGDTVEHADYAWRLSHGDIPRYEQGLHYEPFKKIKARSDVQTASANPPFFYLLQAPVMGPLMNSGKWSQAIAAGRALNILFGVLCVVALAWAGWLFGGKRKEIFAVAVPAIGALTYRFVTLNLNFALDALLVFLSTLAFINIYKLLKVGPERKYIISITMLSILGMLTKAPYIAILAVSLLAIVLSFLLNGKKDTKNSLKKGILTSGGVFLIVILASGWFYYLWNYRSNGTWFRSAPDDYTGGREYKSLRLVIGSSKLWGLFYANYAKEAIFSVAMTSFAAAGIISIKKSKFRALYKDKAMLTTGGLMGLATLAVLLTQITHAVGYGAINFRYILPALLPITLLLAYGLLEFKWTKAQLVSFASIYMGITVILSAATSSDIARLVPAVKEESRSIDKIYIATHENGVNGLITTILLLSFLIGSIMLVKSLYTLSARSKA